MRRYTKTLFLSAIGLAMVAGMGCERMKMGGGGDGAYSSSVNAQPEAVVDAAARAVDEHRGLVLVNAQANELGGKVTGRTVQDRPFSVHVTRQSRGISRVRVETGTQPTDQSLAGDVIDEIRSSVGTGGQGGQQGGSAPPRGGNQPDEPELQ